MIAIERNLKSAFANAALNLVNRTADGYLVVTQHHVGCHALPLTHYSSFQQISRNPCPVSAVLRSVNEQPLGNRNSRLRDYVSNSRHLLNWCKLHYCCCV